MDFRVACRALLRAGTKPTPTAINRYLGRETAHMNRLNGRECRYRQEELRRAGYVFGYRGGRYTWELPA